MIELKCRDQKWLYIISQSKTPNFQTLKELSDTYRSDFPKASLEIASLCTIKSGPFKGCITLQANLQDMQFAKTFILQNYFLIKPLKKKRG